MTISYVGGSAGNQSGGSNLSAIIPAAAQAGDLCLVIAASYPSFTGSPAGFSYTSATLTGDNFRVLYKVLESGDAGATIAFTGAWNSIDRGAMALAVYRGASLSTEVATGGSGTSTALSAVTTSVANSWVVSLAGATGTAAITSSLSGTGLTARSGVDDRCSARIGDQTLATPGTNPTVTFDKSTVATTQADTVTLVPSGSAMTGSLSASIPSLTGALAGTVTPRPITAVLAASLAPLAGTFTNSALTPTGTLTGALPALVGQLGGTTPPSPITGTDTSYGNDSYAYGGTADVTYTAPVAAAPPGLERRDVRRVHQSLPTPTLVKGRPQ